MHQEKNKKGHLLSEVDTVYLPIAFRRGGSNDKFGIWARIAHTDRDLLVNPETLCTYDLSSDDIFIPEEDTFPIHVEMSRDCSLSQANWSLELPGAKRVEYQMDYELFRSRIIDCIAALYHWSVVRGQETAYDPLPLETMGEIMKKMLNGALDSKRESVVPAIIPEDFSFSLQPTDDFEEFGEYGLNLKFFIGNRFYDLVTRFCSPHTFHRLRHDLEHFIYYDEATLRFVDLDYGISEVCLHIEKREVLDETVPVTVGRLGRSRNLVYVSIQCEEQTEIIGYCDLVPTLETIYRGLCDMAEFYEIRRRDYMSRSFAAYLQMMKDITIKDEKARREFYVYAGYKKEAR